MSWVPTAHTDFPIENLPFGVFSRPRERARCGIAIGDFILDCSAAGAPHAAELSEPTLNAFMGLGLDAWREVRHWATAMLTTEKFHDHIEPHLIPMAQTQMHLPARGEYTDFYASIFHATNVGSMFRPDNPLLPNYKHVPIAYHGRASSLVVSGTPVRRPHGQLQAGDKPPVYAAAQQLDYELEVGAWIGGQQKLGDIVPIGDAESRIFGLSLVNDWSARDMQRWEYQPLGPFLAKNFATSVSPWIVSLDALEHCRRPAFLRTEGDPQPLPYLDSESNRVRGSFDIRLEVYLSTEQMRARGFDPFPVSRGSFLNMYWTLAQMVTHHASNGCRLNAGDLLASGTVSGPEPESRGCLLERTWRGTEPFALPSGESRCFLDDGDEVTMRAYAAGANGVRIGFGSCNGRVLPALSPPV